MQTPNLSNNAAVERVCLEGPCESEGHCGRDGSAMTHRRPDDPTGKKDIGYLWIGQLMSPGSALISAQNAKNASGYSNIRQERCKIDLSAAGAPIGPDSMPFQSGEKTAK